MKASSRMGRSTTSLIRSRCYSERSEEPVHLWRPEGNAEMLRAQNALDTTLRETSVHRVVANKVIMLRTELGSRSQCSPRIAASYSRRILSQSRKGCRAKGARFQPLSAAPEFRRGESNLPCGCRCRELSPAELGIGGPAFPASRGENRANSSPEY